MKHLVSLALACVVALSLQAQSTNIEFEEFTLDNGLHVILHQDKSTPIVAVSVMYHVGSKNELPNRTGFAHFFEHLLFEGSVNIERGEFSKYVENAGGILNANTSYDRTYYFEILPSNQLELGLWLESERMLHARVDQIGVETQREVVKEERRQRIDNQPYGSLLEETMKRVFTKHPYSWPIIGSMDHLNAATEQDYKDFYAMFYVPNNAVLSIAGDIDKAEAKELINKYFATIPKGTKEIRRPNVTEPEKTAEVRAEIEDNVQLPAVIQAYKMPAQGTDDSYALQMLGTLLSGGQSSRMQKSIVDEQQKALFVGSFPFALEDAGAMINFGIVQQGVEAADLEKAMIAEVEKAKSALMSDDEFQKLQNQIESNFIQSNSSMAGIAESLANYHMYFGDANLINTELERYRAVTKEDIQRVAKQYLKETNRVTLYYVPKKEKP